MPGLTPRSATTRMSSLQLSVTAFSPSMQSSSGRCRSRQQHTQHLSLSSLSRSPIASFPLSTTTSTTSMRQLKKKKEPEQLRDRYSLPAACSHAIAFMLEKGMSLPRWRWQQIAKMQALQRENTASDCSFEETASSNCILVGVHTRPRSRTHERWSPLCQCGPYVPVL